jgi:LytS/YehU family sensor histidine kinase
MITALTFMVSGLNTRQISFVALMSSLGTLVSGISLNLVPILTAAGIGGAALDLSHIATFTAAMLGGPLVGGLVGLLSGIYAGYYFGYVIGSTGLLSLVGVPVGKALTGLVSGFLYKKLRITTSPHPSILTIPVTLVSYVPEALFTIVYFAYLMELFYGFSLYFLIPVVMSKAWLEITVLSIIMSILVASRSFREFTQQFLSNVKRKE